MADLTGKSLFWVSFVPLICAAAGIAFLVHSLAG